MILRSVFPLVIALARDRRRFLVAGGERDVTSADRARRARFLKDRFVDLGPAFVKLGQMLSTRPDVLPREYVDVLSELQDRVPPAEWEAVQPLVEREVGPVDERFDSFDREPISGASLGQVYEATVDGEGVAVKVLRPGVRERVETDIRVLGTLVPLLAALSPPDQAFTLSNVADEFAVTIRREMDYAHEAASLREIRANMADREDVVVPRVLEDYSTDRVLTMEYVPGTKIDDYEGIDALGVDREALVRRLEEAYIEMILEDGVFHADPHPGNVAVQDDGSIVFYDFGMTGRLGPRTRDHLLDFYVGLARDDVDRVIDAFLALGALDPAADRDAVRRLFEVAIESFRGADFEELNVDGVIREFEGALYEFPLRIPRDLAHVVRVTTVLEGVTRGLVPDFDFVAVVSDYVSEEGLEEEDVVASAVRDRTRETVAALVGAPPALETTLDRIERDDLALTTVVAEDQDVVRHVAVRLVLGMAFSAGIPLVAYYHAAGDGTAAAVAAAGTAALGGLLYWTLRERSGPRFGAQPQFTRQELRARRDDETDS